MFNPIVITIVVSIVLLVSCVEPDLKEPAATHPVDLPKISVALLESVDQVRGMELLPSVKTDRSGSFRSMTPCRLEIVLPEGKSVTLDVRSFFAMTTKGVVTDIGCRRPMEATKFIEVIADLKEVLTQLGIEPGENLKREMGIWERSSAVDTGMRAFRRSGTPAYQHVNLTVDIRPSAESGWFSLLQFGADVEARRYLRHPEATRPAFGPSSQPSGSAKH